MTTEPFQHVQTAHCETGVTQGLLRQIGWNISEPMLFGIGSGIYFIHLPFIKVNGVPATSYRIWAGGIFGRVTSLLGLQTRVRKFKNPSEANNSLQELLRRGKSAGIMCSVYYLPYMPDAYRFHFNAHNLLAIGMSGEDYLISDPILDQIKTISADDLTKARFAKGFPAPNGKMYYIEQTGTANLPDLRPAIKAGIKRTAFLINSPPLPFIGSTGPGFLAKKIRQYPHKYNPRMALLALGNIVRMQEEIGTGGGGFRFMYGAFLEEAASTFNNHTLKEMALEITNIGDDWRNFAYETAKVIKSRSDQSDAFDHIATLLEKIGKREVKFFKDLSKVNLK